MKEALYAQLDVAENVMMKTQKKRNEKNVLIKLVDFAHGNRIENEEWKEKENGQSFSLSFVYNILLLYRDGWLVGCGKKEFSFNNRMKEESKKNEKKSVFIETRWEAQTWRDQN